VLLGAAEVKVEAEGRRRAEGGWGCAWLWVVSEVWGWFGLWGMVV